MWLVIFEARNVVTETQLYGWNVRYCEVLNLFFFEDKIIIVVNITYISLKGFFVGFYTDVLS